MPNWRYFCCFYVITFTWRLFMILLCPWCHFCSVANCAELLFLVGSSSLATEDIAAIFMSLYSSSPSRLLLSLRLPLIYWSLFSPQRRPQPPTFVLLATLMISSSHPSFGLVLPLLPLHLITMIWVDFWHSSWYTGLRGELKVLLPLQLDFFFLKFITTTWYQDHYQASEWEGCIKDLRGLANLVEDFRYSPCQFILLSCKSSALVANIFLLISVLRGR